METKVCTKCKEEKNVCNFYYRQDWEKYISICKLCDSKVRKERYLLNQDTKKNYSKKYYYLNRETKLQYGKNYYSQNKDDKKNMMKNIAYFIKIFVLKIIRIIEIPLTKKIDIEELMTRCIILPVR